VGAVVEHHVQQIRAIRRRRPAAQMHERGAVAVQANDPAPRPGHGDARGDLHRMAHAAHRQKVPRVPRARRRAPFEQFPRRHAGGRHHRHVRGQDRRHGLDRGFPRQAAIRRRFAAAVGRERVLAHDQGRRLRAGQRQFDQFPQERFDRGGLGIRHPMGNAQDVQLGQRDLPLLDVLGLVAKLPAIRQDFAAPTDQQHHRHAVDLRIGERSQGLTALPSPAFCI
jgi:hypothetical protein